MAAVKRGCKHQAKLKSRRVGRKYLGGVDKLEKKGQIRGCKTEIAISRIFKDTTYFFLMKY